MRSPLVSVIIPVFNGANFVSGALDSVRAQAGCDLEVITVDDGSTDDSPRLIAARGEAIRMRSQPNAGGGSARNHGLAQSRGEYVWFLDQDDIAAPDMLARQVDLLRRHGEDDVVIADGCEADGDTIIDRHLLHPDIVARLQTAGADGVRLNIYRTLLRQQPFKTLGQCLFRRSVLESLGPFSEDRRVVSDHEWFLRHASTGASVRFHARALLTKRFHATSHSGTAEQRTVRYTGFILNSLLVQRARTPRRGDAQLEAAIRRAARKLALLCVVHAAGATAAERNFATAAVRGARERMPEHTGLRWAEAWLRRGESSRAVTWLLKTGLRWKRRISGVQAIGS
ncbi:MAG TPA: glycosyltransferase family A protein [Opitutus sp.]|nr:glycosyltransferase family A protein [Opitutus sp.]